MRNPEAIEIIRKAANLVGHELVRKSSPSNEFECKIGCLKCRIELFLKQNPLEKELVK